MISIPADIESMNVLKGTTASALYGSRGRNGAILITTKKARKEGLNVTVSNSTMVTAGFTVYPETQNEYGNGSNGVYEFWDGKDGGISDGDMVWGPAFADNLEIPQWNSPIRDTQTGETIEWYGDVSGTMYDDRSRYERVPIPWKFNDFLNEFLETGYVTNTDVSISYKGEKSSQRFSFNYNKMKGQVPNTELHTGGASLNSTYQLAKNLEMDTKFSYNKVYSPNYPRYGYGPKKPYVYHPDLDGLGCECPGHEGSSLGTRTGGIPSGQFQLCLVQQSIFCRLQTKSAV
jgi:TonB-dependent SusC/RagA subfamily outer membrane receptor